MSTIPCQYEGCTRKTKEPFKLCFTCNTKDKVDCQKCGKLTSKKYPICYNCNMLTKHPCIRCKKMTDKKYLKCYTCNQIKVTKFTGHLDEFCEDTDDEKCEYNVDKIYEEIQNTYSSLDA